MSAISNVRIDLSRVPRFRAELPGIVDRSVGLAAAVFERAAKVGMQRTGGAGVGAGAVFNKSSSPGEFPAVQSGQLRNSIASERAALFQYRVGTNLKRGRSMEFGANVVARNVKYLTIPMNYEASRLLKRYGTVRNIEGIQIIARTKRGWLMGWKAGKQKTTRGKVATVRKTKALFALVPSVVILPRPWLLPTMTNQANQQAAGRALAGGVRAGVREVLAAGGSTP